MYGEPRGGIFQHIAGVLQYRKRARLREAHTPESSQPAATRGRRPKGAAAITPVSRHGANFIRIIADRLPAVKRRTAATAHSGRPRRRRAGQQLHLHRLGHRLFDLRLEHITGNRFRFNCTDGTPGHTLYNENTFEYNGIAVLLKSVPSDPAPDFQNSVFPGNDTDIRLSPGGWAHRESQGVRPGILSKSRLVFYGTLPNFL